MDEKVILACGSRYWTDRETISFALSNYSKESLVVAGGCRGADTIAVEEARKLGMKTAIEDAKWHLYGDSAGPIRNKLMLEKYNPDVVLAFCNDLNRSKGTKNMVSLANNAKKKVIIIGAPQSAIQSANGWYPTSFRNMSAGWDMRTERHLQHSESIGRKDRKATVRKFLSGKK